MEYRLNHLGWYSQIFFQFIYLNNLTLINSPDGLGVRIPGFHPGDLSSIPAMAVFLF